MRLGIFGGTFNPVHTGHLVNAEQVREEFSLDRIFFIPAKLPVHKDIKKDVSALDRYRMVEYAIEGNPHFQALDIEIKRESPSYTVYTLTELGRMYPGAGFFLIIGTDSYLTFDRWKEYRNILDMAALVVMKRTDDPVHATWQDECGTETQVFFSNNPVIDISSTDIRDRIESGRSVRYMVPDRVYRYIVERGLYLP